MVSTYIWVDTIAPSDGVRKVCCPDGYRVAAGDGVCGLSLHAVSAHDIVAGHALLKGANSVLLNEIGESITYRTVEQMATVSQRCFGAAPAVCEQLVGRD